MANSTRLTVVAALLVTAALGAAVLLSSTTGANDGGGIAWARAASGNILTTLPFSPMDILPLLPRRVAMAALRTLGYASDIFPVFVGAARDVPETATSGLVGWKGACFYENEAWLVFNNDSGTEFGGGTVHVKVRSGRC